MQNNNNLKTLKDLGYGEDLFKVTKTELRREAIKWINDLHKNNFTHALSNKIDSRCIDDAVIPWIKHFFNISDEELK